MLVKKLNFQHDNVSATLMYFKGLSERKLSAKSAGNVKLRILCNDEHKMLRLQLHFRMDFFGFRPTETLDAFTSSTDLALNFLPLNEYL